MITKDLLLSELEIIHKDKNLMYKYKDIFIEYLYYIHNNKYIKIETKSIMYGYSTNFSNNIKSNHVISAFTYFYTNENFLEHKLTSILVDDIYNFIITKIKKIRLEKLNTIL